MPYVRTRLGRWFYEERGARKRVGDPTIVLLHGLLFDGGSWTPQVDALGPLGRVLVIDGPGHGKSEVPPPFTLEDNTDALMDALATLDAPNVILVGLSWGGMLAMRAAMKYGRRVAAMALLDTSADAEDRARAVKYRAFASFARRFGLPLWFVQRQLAHVMFGPKTLIERPDVVTRFARDVNGFPRDGVYRAAKAVVVERGSVIEALDALRTPTLVVCGQDDFATPPTHSETLASRIPGAKLVSTGRGTRAPSNDPPR